jgi:hypothetical protein
MPSQQTNHFPTSNYDINCRSVLAAPLRRRLAEKLTPAVLCLAYPSIPLLKEQIHLLPKSYQSYAKKTISALLEEIKKALPPFPGKY